MEAMTSGSEIPTSLMVGSTTRIHSEEWPSLETDAPAPPVTSSQTEYFANSTCLATRPGSECLAILLDEVEADKARKEAAKQAAADSGSGGGDDNTATVCHVVWVVHRALYGKDVDWVLCA